jgi:hypothetical protein
MRRFANYAGWWPVAVHRHLHVRGNLEDRLIEPLPPSEEQMDRDGKTEDTPTNAGLPRSTATATIASAEVANTPAVLTT